MNELALSQLPKPMLDELEVRPYFIDTLVDCLSRLDDERAPQVEAEEQTELTSENYRKG